MSKLASALLAFQTDAPSLHADATNGHFNNKYLSLEGLMGTVRPALNKQGLVLMQFPSQVGGLPALRTKLLHAESGEFEEDTMLLALAKNDPQGQGSGLTYARRYSALSILGLVADEDDDGNATRSAGVAGNGAGTPPPESPPSSAPPAGNFSPPADVAETLAAREGSSVPHPDGFDGTPETVTVSFGKHKGKLVIDLVEESRAYVEWLAGERAFGDSWWEPKSKEQRLLRNASRQILGLPFRADEPDDDGSGIPF